MSQNPADFDLNRWLLEAFNAYGVPFVATGCAEDACPVPDPNNAIFVSLNMIAATLLAYDARLDLLEAP